MSAATMRRRIAGRLGPGGGPGLGGVLALFPPKPQMLQEGEGELAQEQVVVQAAPAPALEMVQAQLILELLVHLLADPARLDQGGQDLERRVGRMIGQVVLALAVGAMLAYEPSLLAGQVLGPRRDRSVGHPHPQGGERGPERTFGAIPPCDGAECFWLRLDQLGRAHACSRR